MIQSNNLLDKMTEKNITKRSLAKKLNISPKTLYLKLKSGIFRSDELEIIVDVLDISNPWEFLFGDSRGNK